MQKVELIVGLGNPGSQYSETRHNAGVWFVESLLDEQALTLKSDSRRLAALANYQSPDGANIKLAVPSTFMNESGRAVRSLSHFFKIKPEHILIVHDELDLPCGAAKLKIGGGHGGHNGLRDISQQLSNTQYARLRIGIGHPGHKNAVSSYVLHKPRPDEISHIRAAIDKARGIMPLLLAGKIQDAMTALHTVD